MRMTGGEAVVRSLQAHGVDTIFGIPGVHNLAVYDALIDSGIRHIVSVHPLPMQFRITVLSTIIF